MNKRFILECERERLHLSGQIQPHGALLIADPDLRITHRSTNLGQYLDPAGVAPGDLLPSELGTLCEDLGSAPGSRLQFPAAINGVSGPLDLVVGRGNGGDILVEMSLSLDCEHHEPSSALRCATANPDDWQALEAMQQELVDRVSRLTGFGRVMFYRFLDSGDGEVTAEARDPAVYGSYFGLRFPASDIPQIARDLYLQNPWRLIADTEAEAVPIEGLSPTPPDLGYSDLRSVSPVHLVYLANMGVRASLSFPVIMAGQLYGLIACHHHRPLVLPMTLLKQLAQEIRSHGLVLTAFIARHRIKLIDGLVRHFAPARAMVEQAGDLTGAWPELGPILAREFGAEGAHLVTGEHWANWGNGFEPDVLVAVDTWFERRVNEALWLCESMSESLPTIPMSRVAGMLALKGRSRKGRPLRLYLTRQEHIHEVAWGGNPEKPVEYHDGVLGISPRRSFETWIEKRVGHSRPWDDETRLLGLRLREMLLDVADLR